jgi:hypothetical protein
MKKKNNRPVLAAGFLTVCTGLFVVSAFTTSNMFTTNYSSDVGNVVSAVGNISDKLNTEKKEEEKIPNVLHVKTPDQVKTIYMTACVAGTPSFRKDLVELIEETEINSIIIDIKDFTGTISYPTNNPILSQNEGNGCRAKDMKDFIKELHEKNIYVIGRVTVFQDPYYTKIRPDLAVKKASDGSVWEDHKGISFIEVGAREYWDYILEIAYESHRIGFDEINFDYVRFPSDGNMKDIYFPFSEDLINKDPEFGKAKALEEFFKYLSTEISEYNKDQKYPMITSADLFGMVTTNYDDLNIGQVLERALPYFDYIAPMVYPSHYPNGFNGWNNPNTVPYELIHYVMKSGVDRVVELKNATSTPDVVAEKLSTKQLRTWIQDFDYGGDYDIAEVRAQIDASYDAGVESWMIWAPSNRYTRGALKDAE